MLKSFYLKIRGNAVEDPSTIKVVCKLLSSAELSSLLSMADDWRSVLDRAAQIKQMSVTELGKKVARKLKIDFIGEVAAIDAWLIPRKFSVDNFKEVGAAPQFENGQLRALICVDPSRLGEIGRTFCDIPRKLSHWGAIEAAFVVRNGESDSNIVEDRVSQLISMVIAEVKSYQAFSVTLDFSKKGIKYSFTTNDQKAGVGSIGSGMKSAVLSRFAHALNEGSGLLKVVGEKGEVVVSLVALSSVQFRLDWEKEEPPSLSPKKSESEISFRSSDSGVPTKAPVFHSSVMVIDDNETFTLVLTRFFEKAGIKVEALSDSSKAIAQLKSGEFIPDAVICDLHMPVFGGLELFRELRGIKRLNETPFILLTSDESPESEIRAISSGVDAFISKSEEPMVLAAYVQKYLDQKLKHIAT